MTDTEDWEFPAAVQPKAEETAFDLDRALSAVVELRAEVPEDAFTAGHLGREREGNGVVIGGKGLVLTVGYLIAEAETVWLVNHAGPAAPAHVVAYDQVTGFGLVQALGALGAPSLALGSAAEAKVGDPVIVAGHGGRRHALNARIMAKREFAGYWEYVLDEALFTTPPHPNWGGTALLGADGKLLGVGSLLVQEADERGTVHQGNLFVPIDLLPPILDDLMKFGKVDRPPRPWLGMFTAEAEGHLVVAGLAEGAPADQADIRAGDEVLKVAGAPLAGLADMFRRIWALGPAGTVVPLTIARDGTEMEVHVRSADRNAFLKSPEVH